MYIKNQRHLNNNQSSETLLLTHTRRSFLDQVAEYTYKNIE
jgi:hypothetical protein